MNQDESLTPAQQIARKFCPNGRAYHKNIREWGKECPYCRATTAAIEQDRKERDLLTEALIQTRDTMSTIIEKGVEREKVLRDALQPVERFLTLMRMVNFSDLEGMELEESEKNIQRDAKEALTILRAALALGEPQNGK